MSPEERLMLEREGAKFGLEYMRSCEGFVRLLASYDSMASSPSEESVDALVAVFTGYLGVMFDEMADVDPRDAVMGTFSTFAVGVPQEVREKIAVRVIEALEKRREQQAAGGHAAPMGAS